MKLPLISAGEFFELLRPAAYVLSALLSIWVLSSAQRRRFPLYATLAWALGTFLLPFVVLPLYLIVLIFGWLRQRTSGSVTASASDLPASEKKKAIKHGFLLPAGYGVVLLGATILYLYNDYYSVDSHLARATQAKLSSQPAKTIREYRAALSLEENPHTHNLLGIELAEAGQWTEALTEFRHAEQGGEPDDLLPFRIARALEAVGNDAQAAPEYKRYLEGQACQQLPPNDDCAIARQRISRHTSTAK